MNNDPTKQAFIILRRALGLSRQPLPEPVDWAALYRFAQKQALVGVMFDAVQRLPREQSPKGRVLLEWVAASEAIRRQNIRLNKATARVYQLISAKGYRCCILKGQGNALLYPSPHSRISGDVDVWLATPKGPISRQQLYALAIALADGDASRLDVSIYHIGLTLGDVIVELHPTPAVLAHKHDNRRLQQWLGEQAQTQFASMVSLPDEAGQVAVPTRAFNLVYQLIHLYHHYFFEGIGLRQFVDYALLLMKSEEGRVKSEEGREERDVTMEERSLAERAEVVKTLRKLHLDGFAGAVMWVLGVVLDLPAETMLVPADERRGRLLLHDILRGGNFGHYDHRFAHNLLGHNLQRLQRDWQNLRYYPHEAMAEPWFRLWHWWWRKRNGAAAE